MIHRLKANRWLHLDDRGISLIEVMIAMFIFSVVALAVSSLNVKTWQVTDLAKSYTEASTEATQKIESLFSEKYVSNQATGMALALAAGISHDSESSDGNYSISYQIRDNDVLPNTKSVQMNVSFYRGGVVKNVRYNYLLPLRK